MTPHASRLALAALALALYAALCLAIWLRERRRHRTAADEADALSAVRSGEAPIIVAHASQTGHAESLARETARVLHAAGSAVRLLPLNTLDHAQLARARCTLFVASTYGEGDAPDNAADFWQRCQRAGGAALAHLHYGVLALGDREYARFCGFGQALDHWLRAAGATPLFERIDMDNGDAAALRAWQQGLSLIAQTGPGTAWTGDAPFMPWTLVDRRVINPDSVGAPIVHLSLQAPGMTAWEPGDLAELRIPADPRHPRSYSIASVMQDGRLELLVRVARRPDGSPGLASRWLAEELAVGASVALRLRAHSALRLGDNATRPILFIGNGTGLAGLRGHLRARAVARTGPSWLVFGERQAAHDFLCEGELRAWLASGALQRLDTAFSRDQPERIYVQHRLDEAAGEVRDWVRRRGGAIYVCGSLNGMAQGVDAALRRILGNDGLAALAREGRYRRDVY
ncbi:sulfite reductase subunit alpha [Ottowia sp.]|uniref:sulfite reductase subunit alpha n=1 Tax=Ottowia sp. TaxID=1898956 RepID=UPI0025D32911|nr:sulfite reductase subunit alpha [Ottowia sp.]MBK6747327.1 flavodoxin domain-containing protein [Ottowia sp.]